jgi:hypothetical protein
VAIIGDSASGGFFNGLNSSLEDAGVGPYRYDIKGSRRITQSWLSYDSGVTAAKKMIRDGFNPKAWVVALGSNDFYFFRRNLLSPRTEIETFLELVGPSRHVVWFTIWTKRARAYYATFNSILRDTAREHANLHVLDWATTAKKHPEWLHDDGAHLKMPGAKARNAALAKAAVMACKAAGSVSGASSSVSNSDRPTLELGSNGAAVVELQQLLTANGIYVRADGDFGPATERAVKRFQGEHGLRQDGIVGPVTWRALDA